MASVLARRQPDVSIVLEDVHDPHNVSAVLRSCDATGVSNVQLVYNVDEPPELSTGVAAGTQRWLTVEYPPDLAACYASLRDRRQTIYATTLAGESHDLFELDLTRPCAFVFGNESRGLSPEAVGLADASLRIPMMGMAESLNISVACAVTLFEMMRQRRAAGMYDATANDPDEMWETLTGWLERDGRDPSTTHGVEFDPRVFPLVWPRTQPMPDPRSDDDSAGR